MINFFDLFSSIILWIYACILAQEVSSYWCDHRYEMYIIKLEKYMKCLSIVYRWWLQWLDKLNNAVLLQLELDRSAKHFSWLVTRYELRYSRNCKVRKSLLQRFFGRTLQFPDLENTAKFGWYGRTAKFRSYERTLQLWTEKFGHLFRTFKLSKSVRKWRS